MGNTEADRRSDERIRALKGAWIVFNNRSSILDCTVRNLSANGLKLSLGTPARVPDEFDLRFANGEERRCLVRWRKLSELGVQFIDR